MYFGLAIIGGIKHRRSTPLLLEHNFMATILEQGKSGTQSYQQSRPSSVKTRVVIVGDHPQTARIQLGATRYLNPASAHSSETPSLAASAGN
jgi:hypothetical protein